MKLNKYIDHTILKPTATPHDVDKLCEEAIEHQFYAVCVNGCYVRQAKLKLQGSKVKLAAVVGFPLGAMTTGAKVFEAKDCVAEGADEIDMVINIGWLKAGKLQEVQDEIAAIKRSTDAALLKVIIETCYLSEEEKKNACRAALRAGADFVKTSTGFGTGGATAADVALMKAEVGDKLEVKASGGIKDAQGAEELLKAGATRLGTSSGIKLVTQNS